MCVLADIILEYGDELNLNLPKFARPVYIFLSHQAFFFFFLIFLGENSQHFFTANSNRSRYTGFEQAWGQDGWILVKFFFCLFMGRDGVEVHKLANKERSQYPAILTEKACRVSKRFVIWLTGKLFSRTRRVVPNGQDSSILPARVANHSASFGSSCPLTELAI